MSLYEGGYRVPFIAWSPGRIQASTTVDTPFACYDTFASLSEWAGLPIPKTDGTSYAPELTGKASRKRDYLYFEYPEASAMQCVHFGNIKVIRPDLKKKPELIEVYNLKDDPNEKRDLASQMPEVVERAKKVFAKEHVPNPLFPLGLVDKK
jgi:arylsulfatase A